MDLLRRPTTPLPDKRVSLDRALEGVRDGCTLAVGGMTLYRRPVRLVLELLKREPRDLTLLAFTAGIECDILVGSGCVARTRTCYFGLEAFGFAPSFTALATAGKLRVVEETEATLAAGLRASLAQVGFMPVRGIRGTDILKARPDLKSVVCPYSGEELLAVPAIRPDVALIHAVQCDPEGNAVLVGNLGVDLEIAALAELTVVSTEQVVPTEKLPERGVNLIGLVVDRVVEAPRGAWPTSCYPMYPFDGEAILRYVKACRDQAFFELVREWQTSAPS